MSLNSMYFNSESVEKGDYKDLIQYLIDLSYKESADMYNDIRICPADMGAIEVQWTQRPWGLEDGSGFQYVDGEMGQVVMLEKSLPDGTLEYVRSEQEWEDLLHQWLDEHPDWRGKDEIQYF